MYIQKLDFLSPEITLYFKGKYKHSSVISGIITIISYFIILICIIYYTYEFFGRGNPTIYFFNRFIEDTGSFPLNASSIFHYINLISVTANKSIVLDFKSISIFGINRTLDSYNGNYDLSKTSHWVYGLCDYDNYNISSKSFNKLIDKNLFSQSACIRKFFD